MASKSSNRKTCKRVRDLFKGASVIAAIFIIGLSNAPAAAAEIMPTDPCDSALINGMDARNIARSLMQERGWIQSRSTRSTLGIGTVFRIQKAKCTNGQWRVSAVLKEGLSDSRNVVVMINCHSGAIETAVRNV